MVNNSADCTLPPFSTETLY